nr:hypothetical protein [Tanacetum cinerariifolium]
MVEENVSALTRSDDELVPNKAHLPIGKRNLLMNLQRKQMNHIFLISLDILQNTNFFGAFTASANVPSIYIQGTNIDFAELIWEEFTQAIKTFFTDAANLIVLSKNPKPYVIPYCRFTKLIIKMAVRKPRQPTAVTDEESMKKKKVPPTDKSKKPAPAKQTKHAKENSTKPTPLKKAIKGKVLNVRKRKRCHAKSPSSSWKRERHCSRGTCCTITFRTTTAKEVSTTDKYIFRWRTPVNEEASIGLSAQTWDDTSTNVVRDTPSPANAKTGADTENSNSEGDTEIFNVDEERGENISNTVALEERTIKLDKGQAGLDPGNTLES